MKLSVLTPIFLLTAVLLLTSCREEEPTPDPVVVDTLPIELSCDHFQTDRVLTDDPDRPVDYRISCVMEADANITVQPGTVIEFTSGAGIQVNSGGSFNATGTEADPISLQGNVATQGHWKGIFFNSVSTQNKLEHISIQHAGSDAFNTNGDIASVIIWGGAKVQIADCNISQSGNYGLSAIYPNAQWSIRNSTLTNNANAPAIFLAPYLAAWDGSNSLTGNGQDYLVVDLATQAIESDLTWANATVPYLIRSTFSLFNVVSIANATVTIESGTEIQFESGNGLQIESNGALKAIGTATEPITFSGLDQTAGSWSGIYFNNPQTTTNEIRHARIFHAGSTLDLVNAGIIMRASPVLTLDQITFSDINGCSIYHKDVMDNPNLTATNLTHNNTLGSLCTD